MKIIGLTGGIGTGKSMVSQLLARLGTIIIDADKIGHEAFVRDCEVRKEIVATFGKKVISASGDIDREKLGSIVFGNPDARARLNRIMHPRMYDTVKTQLEEYRNQGVRVVMLEAPLLLEAGWTSLVEEVWVTTAPEPVVLQRLAERAGFSKAESLTRIHSQIPSEERIKQADVLIDTDCSFDELKEKVRLLWQKLQANI